jgi:hypothetical protein
VPDSISYEFLLRILEDTEVVIAYVGELSQRGFVAVAEEIAEQSLRFRPFYLHLALRHLLI